MYPNIYNNEFEILKLFSENYDAEFYLREMSRLSNLPLKTTQNTLNYLENLKILKSTVQGKNKYFSLNLENISTKYYLLQTEVYNTLNFVEKYPLLKTFVKEIKINSTLIIFGSFASLKADRKSDLDILLISKNEEDIKTHTIPVKSHIIKLRENEFIENLRENNAFIKEIKKKHIILNNHSFYVNTLWEHYG